MHAACKILFLVLLLSFAIFVIAFGTPVLSMFTSAKVLEWAGCSSAGFDNPAIRCGYGGGVAVSERFGPLSYWFTTLLAPYFLVKHLWDVLLGWLALTLLFGGLAAASASKPALKRPLVRLERLCALRGWALGLGLVSMVGAMGAAGFVSMGNPKTWSSAYSAMAAAGMLRWAALPLVMLSAALLAVAVVLHIVVRSHRRRLPDLCTDERKNEPGPAMSATSRRLFSWVLIPLLVALPLAVFMCYAALAHNPQEEFCAYGAQNSAAGYSHEGVACSIRWGALGLVFGVWLLAQLLVLTVARVVLSAFRGE